MARQRVRRVLVRAAAMMLAPVAAWAQVPVGHPCAASGNIVRADVAAIDVPMVFNRLGAQNVNWQMYTLWRDLVHTSSGPVPQPVPAFDTLTSTQRAKLRGKVTLRPDLRPRPLVLRVAAGQCLQVRFVNLLTSISNPRNGDQTFPFAHPLNQRSLIKELPADHDPLEKVGVAQIDNQVASRYAGFHPAGLEWVRGSKDDASMVGANASSLASPGAAREYLFYAPKEGAYLVSNPGAAFGGEGTAGTSGTGLFGMVAVQPAGARAYRGQVTEEELRLATRKDASGSPILTPQGHPVVDYEAKYPDDCASGGVWCREGKSGTPILAITSKGQIVHSDLNAVIVGPNDDGSFPPQTYPLESNNARNPTLPNRLEPFREFASVYHDENAAAQAFPKVFDHPVLGHTLHGVRDAFMINYGSAGVGAEVIANRLRVGPMHDCVDCAFEEFFLSSFTVGDPALLVDTPANIGLEGIAPVLLNPRDPRRLFGFDPAQPPSARLTGPKAKTSYYPHDPSNVHHSYQGDAVRFRNVHTGKEQHIFHLHNHQWLFNPNDDNANYIDAQAVGPGSGYTYEIAFGGSGNRNKTAGDAVFHCHFYPHFAQGMWYLWRIHDTFEAGTRLAASGEGTHKEPYALKDGRPARGARALPDGEIAAGTPIPAVVPLPGKALPPMPGKVEVVVNPRSAPNGAPVGSLASVIDRDMNPGYPFWIGGIEHTVGSRPPTPPLDMDASAGGADGGVPRHTVQGYSAGSDSEDTFHRLSAEKKEKKIKPVYLPEHGTDIEQVAMKFHSQREWPTSAVLPSGAVAPVVHKLNGAKPTPGAPFFDPCIDDRRQPLVKTEKPLFFNGQLDARSLVAKQQAGDITGLDFLGASPFDSQSPRIYKGANIQLDTTFNKLGYHYTQQRILTLWGDVADTLDGKRPPEPLVLRMNTFDCARYLHTNLVPKLYELDDYQVTTPTDVIGQHIHLPKWDLPSADGSANGWNYEDGTFSPGMVRSRIHAINAWNEAAIAAGKPPVPNPYDKSLTPLKPRAHYYFGRLAGKQWDHCEKLWDSEGYKAFHNKDESGLAVPGTCDWLGARTTIQRWFSDPLINSKLQHRGLGTTFTHDHLGPSTHQQTGLYATMLSEPPGAVWRHNESGDLLYNTATRDDGGPTSWQAVITGPDGKLDFDGNGVEDSHREFFLQFGDFQHAYQRGVEAGVSAKGIVKPPTPDTFRSAINPSYRKPAGPSLGSDPDILAFEPTCPSHKALGPVPRPCPEIISADDIGMMVINYRNEPVAARVYDPQRIGSDGKKGTQAAGAKGDLAFAFQTRTDRKLTELNTVSGASPYSTLTHGVLPGDPFTPILRTYSGDLVRVKIQAGSHEHEHNGTIHGMKWLQGGSGYGAAPHSGWRNAQNTGLSEQFTFTASIFDYEVFGENATDRLYAADASQDGLWNGVWGLLRSYHYRDPAGADRLQTLPQNPLPTLLSTRTAPGVVSLNECKLGDKTSLAVRSYRVVAVLANQALGNSLNAFIPAGVPGLRSNAQGGGTLVYNHRPTEVTLKVFGDNGGLLRTDRFGIGPLHDPTAILLVREQDYDYDTGKLKAGVPVEPLVLRASAGECVQVTLINLLPQQLRSTPMPDLYGYTTLSHTVTRDFGSAGSSMRPFNNNLIRPSHWIGLHPQMVHYDVQSYDGSAVGTNLSSLVAPGGERIYQWYAGGLELTDNDIRHCKAEADNKAVFADLNTLRNRVGVTASGQTRLLRPAADVNSVSVLATRLLRRLEQALSTEAEDEERQPAMPTSPPNPATPLGAAALAPLPALAAVAGRLQLQPSLAAARPDVAAAPAGLPVSTLAAVNAVLPTLVSQLQAQTTLQPCLETAAAPLDVLQTSNRTRALAVGVEQFLHDDAPLLPGSQAFDRLGGGFEGETTQLFIKRQQCALANREVIRESIARVLNQPEFKQRIGISEVNTKAVSEDLADSLAFLVPGIDRDALGSDEFKAGFQWWKGRYPLLSAQTTRIVNLGEHCRFEGIEFGGSNLTPPDRIKQGQKAAVGALVVLPENSHWRTLSDDSALDRQSPGAVVPLNRRPTRTTADVVHPTTSGSARQWHGFRDLVAVHQKALNLRYGKVLPQGDPMGAVASLAAEREDDEDTDTAPEDAHDAGQMAINYGTEPLWFRFGIAPDAPFGHGGKPGLPIHRGEGLGGLSLAYQGFSDRCCAVAANQPSSTAQFNVGEPATPVFTVPAGAQSRLRAVMPTGVGRATTMQIHGHTWRRDPYLAKINAAGPGTVGSQCIGNNPLSMWMGGQDSITPSAHFDFVLDATGGQSKSVGDFLYRDIGGFGLTGGVWALLRTTKPNSSALHQAMSRPLRKACE